MVEDQIGAIRDCVTFWKWDLQNARSGLMHMPCRFRPFELSCFCQFNLTSNTYGACPASPLGGLFL